MFSAKTNVPRLLLALLLCGGLLGTAAHAAEADHGEHEATCLACVLFDGGVWLAAAVFVFYRSIACRVCSSFVKKVRVLHCVRVTGRSPPPSF